MLDIISFLDKLEIEYKRSGKNVTSGWVEINCPYPSCYDPSFHCGVNLKSGKHNCWICGNKGGMPKLISRILEISYKKAEAMVEEEFGINLFLEDEEEIISANKVFFPKESTKILPIPHREYLIGRNFDPDFLIKNYKIRACYLTGDYSYRIIIPIIINNILVSFTSRDITGEQDSYKNLSKEKSIIPVKNCVYGIDSITNKIVIVEGVFDAWRIGNGAVATFGKVPTSAQIKTIVDKKSIKEVFILYDNDAEKNASKLGSILSNFFKKVEVLDIDLKDPAEMTEKDIEYFRKHILK